MRRKLCETAWTQRNENLDAQTVQKAGRRLRRRIAAFSAVIAIVIAAVVAFVAVEERRAALERANADASNLSAAFEEQVRRVMNGVAGAMELLTQRIEAEGAAFDLARWSSLIPELAASTIQAAVIGPDGRLVATTLEKNPQPLDLSDREHFRVHKDNPRLGLFIGKPVQGRVSKQFTIQVTRRLERPGGGFAGVLVFSLNPEFLTTLHKSIDLGRTGSMTLAGTDAVVRARLVSSKGIEDSAIGLSIGGVRALEESAANPGGSYIASSRIDAQTRMFHWRRVAGYPLVVIVGLGEAEMLGAANRHGFMVLILGAFAILLVCLMAALLMKEISRRVTHEIAVLAESEKLKLANETLTLQHSALLITSAELAGERINLQKSNAELLLAQQRSEAASRAKSAFLANMSHELRTPLNAIIGFSEMIGGRILGPVSPKYFDYATDIHKAGVHLLELINDILDIAKIEAGKIELCETAVNLTSLLEASLSHVEIQAKKAQVKLLKVYPEHDLRVLGDEKRLKQIVINILSNAVKFTPAGGLVELSPQTEAGGDICIAIRDTGIGMSAADIETAFENFRQIDNSFTKRFEGTGLGLPLSRQLVELHGGSLIIQSVPQAGTEVRIVLPARRALAGVISADRAA